MRAAATKPTTAETWLPNQADSAGLARQFVAEQLAAVAVADPEVTERLKLVVSEFVTNVHCHTEVKSLRLTFSWAAGGVRVAVYDSSDLWPVRGCADASGESGRGLCLVQALADEWGADRVADGGKVVWARFRGAA